jgi:hypothetical protein
MTKWRLAIAITVTLSQLPMASTARADGGGGAVNVTGLTTEHLADPLGIVPGR